MIRALILSFLLFFISTAQLVGAAQTFWPSAIPLLLRTPYLNSWLDSRPVPPNIWPHFWNDIHILGQTCQVRVGGQTYGWLGEGGGSPTNVTAFTMSPTRTTLTIQANQTLLNITFFSPIEPSDLALQSFPFTYIYVDVVSGMAEADSVQLYCDLTGEWMNNPTTASMQWSHTETSKSFYHQASLVPSVPMSEDDGQLPQDSTLYFAAPKGPGLTYSVVNATVSRAQFSANGSLTNSSDAPPRIVADNWPVLALAMDLGNISSTASPTVWAIGLVRNPTITYATGLGSETRTSYCFTKHSSISDAIDAFLEDFPNAKNRADALDQKVLSDANSISPNYGDLLSSSLRQTMASLDITVPVSAGGMNASDILIFMKDVGDSRRVNPVEGLFASFPALLYLNASYGGYILEPLLRYQSTVDLSKQFSVADLGANYPVAQGNQSNDAERAIEDSGSMLIMAWAHAKFSGDSSLLSRYYATFQSWATYLTQYTAAPTGFTTCDGITSSTSTNLAIKGIIGLRCMAEISRAVGDTQAADTYQSTAQSYVTQWQSKAGSTGHLQATYEQPSSWGLMYNMFADKWLGLNLIDQKIYDMQDQYYANTIFSSASQYGIPYDSRLPNEAKAHWTMFTAAAISDAQTRNAMIDVVHRKFSYNGTAGTLPTTYYPNNGTTISGQGSPALGAMFAPLALNLPSRIVISLTGTSKKPRAALIAGCVVAALVFVTLLVGGFVLWRRRFRKATMPLLSDRLSASSIAHSVGLWDPQYQVEPFTAQIPELPNPIYNNPRALSSTSPLQGCGGGGTTPPAIMPTTRHIPLPSNKRRAARSAEQPPAASPLAESLISEVVALRREMNDLRAGYEPPPQYHVEGDRRVV